MLKIENLHVSYGGIKAVKGISFEVPDKSIVTLIGANGAGKSTTLRTIAGQVKAESGSITYDEEELLGKNSAEIVKRGITLVPEGRHEVTTEGGLDIVAQEAKLKEAVDRLSDAGIISSVFIDADLRQVEAAARIGARVCEIHTGPYAHAFHTQGRDAESPAVLAELEKVRVAGDAIRGLGMRFNAGHALNYFNVQPVARLPGIRELHIGHSIVCRAVFVGLREAVREMKRLMREAAALPPSS